MNPRLASLLRQREIISEHLRWLEVEIEQVRAALATSPATSETQSPKPPPSPVPPAARAAGQDGTSESTSILEFPAEVDVIGTHNEVRRGCLLYAAIAFGLLGVLVAAIYWRY